MIPEIDAYIAGFPTDVQDVLRAVRAALREGAPEATERISYPMPTLYLEGNLVHFAAWKRHIGLYPAPSGIFAFAEDLAPYVHAKGSVQFPLDQPMSFDLMTRIARFRAAENRALAAEKRAKKRAEKA